MAKHNFLHLLPELTCAFLYFVTAVQPAAADDYIVDDKISVNNQLYTLAFKQQSVFNPTLLDIVCTVIDAKDIRQF